MEPVRAFSWSNKDSENAGDGAAFEIIGQKKLMRVA
jgi:hypothetical protein